MRKERTVTVTDEGRDKGRVFHLTEMPASDSVAMIDRMMILCANAGVDVGINIFGGGARGLIAAMVQALPRLRYDDVAPLLARAMQGIKIVADPNNPNVTRALVENDVEEPSTWYFLRMQVLDLHTGFLSLAGQSPMMETPASTNSTTSSASNTRISRAQPGRSSPRGARA